jgi:hypothetical protein
VFMGVHPALQVETSVRGHVGNAATARAERSLAAHHVSDTTGFQDDEGNLSGALCHMIRGRTS